MTLLQMEQSWRAQEKVGAEGSRCRGQRDPRLTSSFPVLAQLLWDLELLTGVGLGLFWPHCASFCVQRDQAQPAWGQCGQRRAGTPDCEQPVSRRAEVPRDTEVVRG